MHRFLLRIIDKSLLSQLFSLEPCRSVVTAVRFAFCMNVTTLSAGVKREGLSHSQVELNSHSGS